MMFQLGQVLKGRLGSYRLIKKLQDSVWLAANQQIEQNVIVKHIEHFRVRNERDMLQRFQSRSEHIRPLIDEIELDNGSEWPALVLRWLDDDVLHASNSRQLTRAEVKRVGHGVLKALAVLHEDGFAHTDVKPSNILVNYDPSDNLISDVQLADLECTLHEDSKHAKGGDRIGTPIFKSPEAILELRWGPSTDIWSFGTTLISLIYGGSFHIFSPNVGVDHEEYELRILMRHNEFFGPFPEKYQEIADPETVDSLIWVMTNTVETLKPFQRITSKEVSDEDKRFLSRIMRLDPRDRPTVRELLEDEWFESTKNATEVSPKHPLPSNA